MYDNKNYNCYIFDSIYDMPKAKISVKNIEYEKRALNMFVKVKLFIGVYIL